MSTFGDAVKAIQQIMLMQHRIEQIEASHTRLADDVDGLAAGLVAVDRRVAQIEGFLQGSTTTAPRRTRLPKA